MIALRIDELISLDVLIIILTGRMKRFYSRLPSFVRVEIWMHIFLKD